VICESFPTAEISIVEISSLICMLSVVGTVAHYVEYMVSLLNLLQLS